MSTTNFILGETISRINMAVKKHLISVKVHKTKFNFNLLRLLYKNGVIMSFCVKNRFLLIFLKYSNNKCIITELKIISTPGCRIYWNLSWLNLNHQLTNFSGFYIISSPKGLITSHDALLFHRQSGEVILRIIF